MSNCTLGNPTAHVTLKINWMSPNLIISKSLSQCCIQVSFKIIQHSVPEKSWVLLNSNMQKKKKKKKKKKLKISLGGGGEVGRVLYTVFSLCVILSFRHSGLLFRSLSGERIHEIWSNFAHALTLTRLGFFTRQFPHIYNIVMALCYRPNFLSA